jgi:dTDP-D-glucose 4,6-dehydratase
MKYGLNGHQNYFNHKRYFITNEKLKELGWNINIDFITGISNLIFI